MSHDGSIRVLVVDDSPIFRSGLCRNLDKIARITVVGGAKDAFEARGMILQYRPHVIVLDLEMPRMDGLSFLAKLQEHYPVPVIMCCPRRLGGRRALEAVEKGAFDFVSKSDGFVRGEVDRLAVEIGEKIFASYKGTPPPLLARFPARPRPESFRTNGINPGKYLVVIGASTGGTEAIKQILEWVPSDFPPVAIVQHMPEGFTHSFAQRLDELSALSVSEAVQSDILVPGHAFLARGGLQMAVRARGRKRWLVYDGSEQENRHCPSVDHLFRSVAYEVGAEAIGVILTGMGADGAKGLLLMREAGAVTIGQDSKSCIVYGMPKVAFELGAVEVQAPPADIPRLILQAIKKRETARIPTRA